MRTSSLVLGTLWIVMAVVAVFDGSWNWFSPVQAALGIIWVTQGILADVELNRREHGNYPPTDPDGLLTPVDDAEHQSH